MGRLTERKIVLITRNTRLEDLIARHNTVEQARFYVEHLGSDFSDYAAEDRRYKSAVDVVRNEAEQIGRVQIVNRSYVHNFMFGSDDIVVAVGQDGLVANTLKYLSGQPLIGINPDPSRWDGVLLPFRAEDIQTVLKDVINNRRRCRKVTMAKAVLNDGQVLYGVNDLFIGQRTHVSARYCIKTGGITEEQSSSGIIVSTGLGSTGWLSGILAGAAEIAHAGRMTRPDYSWEADKLQYAVREPFPSRTTGTDLVFGEITENSPLAVTSHMPENGVIFSDGMEADALEFPSGVTAIISIAEKKGRLVV